jgi:hypothetical protein
MAGVTESSPAEEYSRRLRLREARVQRLERTHIRIGNLRLLTVLSALLCAWLSFGRELFSAWWLLLFAVAFLALIVFHAKVLRRKVCAERAVAFYRQGIDRMEDRWVGKGQRGEPFDASKSLYASDLNLFGEASMFELLSQARTKVGEETLAGWLLAPATVEEARMRQAAVQELRPNLDLREDIAVLGEDVRAWLNPPALLKWAGSPNLLTKPWLRWLALGMGVIAVATVVLWAAANVKWPFFVMFCLCGIVFLTHVRQVHEVMHGAEHRLKDLELLSLLLRRLEKERFEGPRLKAIRDALSSHEVEASAAIRRLATIVEYYYSLDNPIVRAFDIPLLYSVQLAYAAEAWRGRYGRAVKVWLECVGEMEALLSIAGYSFERPDDRFPEFAEGEPRFDAEQLGHPLIAAARCVRNDVHIGGETRALLISGSNMSGKSTLLRSVGLNTVLALVGAPVRARKLQLTRLQVGASILINDSLQEGSSRFYAEITRLRRICDAAESDVPVLFLLDELLQGTNSHDRRAGAEGVVKELLERGAIGLISTHDLALAEIGLGGALRNMHFEDTIADGKMTFDYKLREGVVTKSNGIELMRLIGLKV